MLAASYQYVKRLHFSPFLRVLEAHDFREHERVVKSQEGRRFDNTSL
jgi:hypothetical protein